MTAVITANMLIKMWFTLFGLVPRYHWFGIMIRVGNSILAWFSELQRLNKIHHQERLKFRGVCNDSVLGVVMRINKHSTIACSS